MGSTVLPAGSCLPGFGGICHLPITIARDGWAAVVQSFARSVGSAVTVLFTFWEKVPAPSLSAGAGSPVGSLQGLLWWIVGPVAVVSVLVGAGRMALARRAQPGVDTVRSVAVLAVVMGAGVVVTAGLVSAADGFADYVLQQSSGGGFQERLAAIGAIDLTATPQLGGSTSSLVLIVALVAILGSLVQCAVLVLRGALLVVMVATLPLAAAATNTEVGRAWFKRSTAWLVAFILIKPAAALVYATAFYLIGDGTDAASELGGMMLLALAAFTLPALMRLLVPAVSSASAGIGAGEAVAGLGAVATGAIGLGALARGSSSTPAGSAAAGGSPGGMGSAAGLAPSQTTSSQAAGAMPNPAGSSAAGTSGAAPSAGTSGPGGATGGAGLQGAPGSDGGAGPPGAAAAAGVAGVAAAAAGGPVGMSVRAGLSAAKGAARGVKSLGDAAAGEGER